MPRARFLVRISRGDKRHRLCVPPNAPLSGATLAHARSLHRLEDRQWRGRAAFEGDAGPEAAEEEDGAEGVAPAAEEDVAEDQGSWGVAGGEGGGGALLGDVGEDEVRLRLGGGDDQDAQEGGRQDAATGNHGCTHTMVLARAGGRAGGLFVLWKGWTHDGKRAAF